MFNSKKLPFLFYIPSDIKTIEIFSLDCPKLDKDKYIIKIGLFDFIPYNSRWMADNRLGNSILMPDLDYGDEYHEFDTLELALEFIKNWYINLVG